MADEAKIKNQMKFIVTILLMSILAFTACLFMPWWSIAITSFLVGALIPQKKGIAFLSGFLSLFFLWLGLTFWMSFQNNDILAHRISLLILKKDSPLLLMFITAMIGGLVSGMAALTGSLMRSVVPQK